MSRTGLSLEVVKPGSLPATPAASGPDLRIPAEGEVCREFAPRIRAIALRHLKDRSSADDIVQEVLASVVLALRDRRIEQPEHLGAYVFSACRRRIADAHRTEARRSALREEIGIAGVTDSKHADVPNEKHLDIDQLLVALTPLSGRERQIIVETFSADRSAEEIAQSIGTTAGHVRVLRHRALCKMRAALGWQDEP